VNPFLLLMIAVAAVDLVGVPWGFLRNDPDLFQMAKFATREEILGAYWWTLYGAIALVVLAAATGTIGTMRRYHERALDLPDRKTIRRWWMWLSISGWAAVAVMFVQAGFTVPWLLLRGANFLNYTESAVLRTYFSERINPSLYNFNLLFVATSVVALSFFCGWKSTAARLASVALFLASASFSLAKSQLAAAVFIVLLFVTTTRHVKLRTLVVVGVSLLICILPFYFLLAYATTLEEASSQLAGRVIYGQWAGFPYYFELFADNPQPMASLLPPYVQRAVGIVTDSPGRKVMLFMEPYAALEGVAGNVPTFFVGEAFAVAGVPGALLSPFILAAELWLLAICFQRLPKHPLLVLLFSWFVYKTVMGVTGGFSAFLISSFTMALALLAGAVLLRETVKVPRYA
jgi:hypothetical protein